MPPVTWREGVCAFGCAHAHHHLSSLCPVHPPARSPRRVRVPDRPPHHRRAENVAKRVTFGVTRGDAEEREARRRASRARHQSHWIHALDVTCARDRTCRPVTCHTAAAVEGGGAAAARAASAAATAATRASGSPCAWPVPSGTCLRADGHVPERAGTRGERGDDETYRAKNMFFWTFQRERSMAHLDTSTATGTSMRT